MRHLAHRPELKMLEEALADPRWDFRTAEGLAVDLDVAPDDVIQVFREHPEIVRKSVLTDRAGKNLYTAQDRPLTWSERIERFRAVL